ncbi:hypothetical protein BJV78DRAFT_1201299 [Lactifluus subvellereus]|nr:hypothetical protein BJV78DRAFT_1201299 [Lactifluus subvellereus]
MGIRRIYIDLHQDTDAAPGAFTAFTNDRDNILHEPLSYPSCNLQDHRSPAHEVVDHGGAMGAAAHIPATTPIVLFPTAHVSPYPADDSSSGHVPGPSRRTFPATTSSHPASPGRSSDLDSPQRIADHGTTRFTTDILSTTNPIPQSALSGGTAPQYLHTVPGSLFSPTFPLAHGTVRPWDLHSPADLAVSQSDHIPLRAVSSLSSSTTASFVTAGMAILGAHDDAQNPNFPTQPELARYSSQSEPSTSNLFPTTLRPENLDPSESPT